jgi:hypothetical protein
MDSEPRPYTDDFKREVVSRANSSGTTVSQLAQELGLSTSTIYRWRRQFADEPAQEEELVLLDDFPEAEDFPEADDLPGVQDYPDEIEDLPQPVAAAQGLAERPVKVKKSKKGKKGKKAVKDKKKKAKDKKAVKDKKKKAKDKKAVKGKKKKAKGKKGRNPK